MNFTPELSTFQGAIISADNVHQFSRVTARGGHEDEILDIVSRLYVFLQEKRYINSNGLVEEAKSILRKLTFYIILNGDFPVLEDLVELPGIDMAIWTIPTVPKCLVCEMIWGLSMQEFLYEAIAMSYPTLSMQVLTPFVDNIKHYSPSEACDKVRLLAAACYKFISRLIFFDYPDSYVNEILSEAYELFLRTITYFVIPPNEGRLNSLSEDDTYKYKGKNLRILLKLVLECLGTYTSVETFDPEGFREIYLWTIKPEKIKTESITHKVCDSQDEKLTECLIKFNTALLDKCKALIMDVSVDIFCAWSEYDENGKSMQQSIGELCYLLHSKLNQVSQLAEHPLIEMLPQISCKPVDIHDIIQVADKDTLIEHVNSDLENRALWLQALLNKDNLLHQVELVQCLIINVQHIDEEHSKELLEKIIVNCKENDPQDIVKHLGIKIFSKSDSEHKQAVIKEFFAERTFTNRLETSDFDNMITEVFNKLIAAKNEDLSEILNVFIQNPHRTYSNIISCATENLEQCDIMLGIMKLIEDYSNHFYQTDTDPCIMKTIQDFSQDKLINDNQRSNFVNFIIKLKAANIVPGVKLLLLNVMPNLHKALISNNVTLVGIQLHILDKGFSMEELVIYRAPLLAMLAQIMEVVRWTIITFTITAAEVLEQAIQLQIKFFNSYEGDIPDKDAKWLKAKLKNLSPLNMYYYRKLWDPPGSNFIEVVSGEKNLPADKLTLLLSKLLSTATSREWSEVWDSLSDRGDAVALDALFDATTIMATAEKSNRSQVSWACVANCYRNLIVVIKDKFLKKPLSNSQVEQVLMKVIVLLDLLENDLEELSPTILSLLSYVFERKADYTYDITKFSDKIRHQKFKDMVIHLFSNKNIGS